MAYTTQEELNNIRVNSDIIDIVSSYIPLTQKGKNYFCVCPFHDDHSPSMSVSKDRQIYKCFSCGAGGNVFTFVQNYENVSFGESVDIVANKIGMSLKSSYAPSKIDKNKKEHELFSLVRKFYQNNLNTDFGTDAQKYLFDRGISEEMIKDFGIGFALSKNDALYKLLDGKKYEKKYLSDLGLINVSDKNAFDVFVNRIVFPLEDSVGNVVAFTGRIYDGSQGSKYVNSKETYLFKKGQILYNYHRAKDNAKREKQILVVEGNLDAIRLYSLGIKNVVALMGTSFTKEQAELLKKIRVPVILCLDSDAAGLQATYKIGEILVKNSVDVSVIRLSDAKDPDEYVIKKGIDAFIDNLKDPIKFFDFKLEFLKNQKNLNNTEELADYINDVITGLSTIEDDVLKELTLNKLSKEYGVSLEILRSKLVTNLKKEQEKEIKIEVVPKKSSTRRTRYQIASENALYYMMNDSMYVKIYLKRLGFFPEMEHRLVANEILYYYEKNKTINIADFISFIGDKEEINNIVQNIITSIRVDIFEEHIFEEYISVIKKVINEKEIEKIKGSLKKEMDINGKLKLVEKLVELKKEV